MLTNTGHVFFFLFSIFLNSIVTDYIIVSNWFVCVSTNVPNNVSPFQKYVEWLH